MMKHRLYALTSILVLVVATIFVTRVPAQRETDAEPPASSERWEYLVVSGGNVNLNPTGSPSMRKEPAAGFTREGFVLQQNLDKLGAKGWELVSVEGPPADPTFFFKRRK